MLGTLSLIYASNLEQSMEPCVFKFYYMLLKNYKILYLFPCVWALMDE